MTIATTNRTIMSAEDVVTAVSALQPTITARSAEIEAARRVPSDLLDELIGAGCFRVLLPPTHGGLGADLADAMRVFEAVARSDASTAWTVMIGAGSWCDLAALPRATFDELFAAGSDPITAGVFNPTGSIAAMDGGYRVSGRWAFASGCEHATVLFGNGIEGVIDGVPQMRIAVFSPEQVVIEDTWYVSGLSGTGSHHFHVDDLVVPADWTVAPLTDPPSIDEPLVRIPPPALLSLTIASVALGVAQGALDDIVALAADKVPLLAGGPLAGNPLFQYELATADTDLRVARALLREMAEATWATAQAGGEPTLEQEARIRAAAVWATERARSVTEAAYRSAGSSAIDAARPLQRRLRDLHAITQHFLVKRDTLTTAGAILAGQDIHVLVF